MPIKIILNHFNNGSNSVAKRQQIRAHNSKSFAKIHVWPEFSIDLFKKWHFFEIMELKYRKEYIVIYIKKNVVKIREIFFVYFASL
jgi:hypothetical protein